MSDVLIEAKGHNGQLELTANVVRIKRKGMLAFMTQGLKGDKEILVSQISSIQFKTANMLTNGYIQFAFLGGREAKGGLFQGTQDENTVIFTKGQQGSFEAFRDALQKRINSTSSAKSSHGSSMEELEKLASLRDRGIVTEEEFQIKKKEILGL